MASRAKNSLVRVFIEVAALLPWWLTIVLAAGAWGVLHLAASITVPIAVTPAQPDALSVQINALLLRQTLKTLARYFQYIVPFLLLAGTLVSVLRQRRRAALFTGVAGSGAEDPLNNITWREFEHLVGEVFRRKGYSVIEIGGGGPDGGIDLELRRGRERFLVQCKQWRAFRVSVHIVRELYGVMAARGAAGGFVVTSGAFTNESWAFANGRNIELIDGRALRLLISQLHAEQTPPAPPPTSAPIPPSSAATTPVAEPPLQLHPRAPSRIHMPTCPRCGSTMTRRVARSGSNAGKPFWGCTRFPDCRCIRLIEQAPVEEMAIKTW